MWTKILSFIGDSSVIKKEDETYLCGDKCFFEEEDVKHWMKSNVRYDKLKIKYAENDNKYMFLKDGLFTIDGYPVRKKKLF